MAKVSSLLMPSERRAISGLAGLYASRMLGLFMVLPVLAIYADDLAGSTPLLVGVALGIYGLTQACLQIPFGLMSDRFGRKRMIAIGLVLFALGSAVAALADSIVGIIAGRALQGSGAVAAAIMALLADQTREQVRTAAMATIGLSIGVAFAVAMALGPWLASVAGLSSVFWFTTAMTGVGLFVLWRWVPAAPRRVKHKDVGMDRSQLGRVLTRPDLWRIDLSIFALHLTLMASFVAVPLRLVDAGIDKSWHGLAYLAIMGAAFVLMVPLVIVAEKKQLMKPICLLAIGVITLSLAGLGLPLSHGAGLFVLLLAFFTGFNLLEATLPSMLSKLAPAGSKGTAMGVYSTGQFLGAFLGGTLGGWLSHGWGLDAVFLGCAALALVWWGIMWSMPKPPPLASEIVPLDEASSESTDILLERLSAITGVEDVMLAPEEQVAYLKVNRQTLDQAALDALLPEAQSDTPEAGHAG